MSYVTMDHAGWVEENNRCARKGTKKPRSDSRKGPHAAPEKLTVFQATVMDILGMVGGGIYNAPIVWDRVEWGGFGLGVPWRATGGLATFDSDNLTRLVLLCHAARIRCSIRPHGFGHFLLFFTPREEAGRLHVRHPNVEEMVARFRAYLPEDHRITYRAPDGTAADAEATA